MQELLSPRQRVKARLDRERERSEQAAREKEEAEREKEREAEARCVPAGRQRVPAMKPPVAVIAAPRVCLASAYVLILSVTLAGRTALSPTPAPQAEEPLLPRREVVKRLRMVGAAATLFGETNRDRQRRMRRVEKVHLDNLGDEGFALQGGLPSAAVVAQRSVLGRRPRGGGVVVAKRARATLARALRRVCEADSARALWGGSSDAPSPRRWC